MGNNKSKSPQNSGDPQVQILNQLELHEEYHVQNEIKLNIILALVTVQIVITVYKLYKEHARKQAIKAVKSIADLTNA